jgi:hypothetical protein
VVMELVVEAVVLHRLALMLHLLVVKVETA